MRKKAPRNFRKLYQTYIRDYNRRAAKSYVGMEDQYTYDEFVYTYRSVETVQKEKWGDKPLNTMRTLVASQEKYTYSAKQAHAIYKQMNETTSKSERVKLKDIRSGTAESLDEFWDYVGDTYSYAAEKYGKKNAGKYVANVIFGSE